MTMSYRLTPLHIKFVIALLTCLSALAGYLLLLYRISVVRGALVTTLRQTEDMRAAEEHAFLLDRALVANKQKLERLSTYFITESEVPSFISRVEGVAQAAGLSLQLSSLTTDTTKGHPTLGLVLTLHGSFAALGRFMQTLSLLPVSLRIESTTFTESSDAGVVEKDAGLAVPTQKKSGASVLPVWTAAITVRVLSFLPKEEKKENVP